MAFGIEAERERRLSLAAGPQRACAERGADVGWTTGTTFSGAELLDLGDVDFRSGRLENLGGLVDFVVLGLVDPVQAARRFPPAGGGPASGPGVRPVG